MELYFDDNVPQAEREFRKIMDKNHVGKMYFILGMIKEQGFHKVPPKLAKHLWDDIYEIKPDDRRVVYVKIKQSEGVIVKAYIKKSNKMPEKVRKAIISRAKNIV